VSIPGIDTKAIIHDIWTSTVRTFTPLIVGAVIAWGARIGFNITGDLQDALTTLIGGLFALVYYVGVRLLEQRYPGASKFLLSRRAPVGYARTEAILPGALLVAEGTTEKFDDGEPEHRA
jgi:hypothetical protein